ncbi:hypothetical protein [Brevundimonas subvibrioides]|uniref:hypothetical protein n=1 Tax=Brevundimonas subvibrioides TaxID=74313 RepID=UPI0022B57785|nr:hypothetical protein [Brevundimonas subvibrioides]
MRDGTTALKSISLISYTGFEFIELNLISETSPLEVVLDEIFKCIAAGLVYPALHLALSVPDVCSSLETAHDEDARFRIQRRYVAWCETYLSQEFLVFTASDCWALRGGVLHNGMFASHPGSQYDRILFTLPNPRMTLHENISRNNGGIIESALQLDAKLFCEAMATAARRWYLLKKDDPKVVQNLPNLVRVRPNGVSPHIVGVPLIA